MINGQETMASAFDGSIEGPRLRKIREAAGYSQQDLADSADLVQTTISNWERNKLTMRPNVRSVRKLASFLGLPIIDLGPAGRPIEIVCEEVAQRETFGQGYPNEERGRVIQGFVLYPDAEDWGRAPGSRQEFGFRGRYVSLVASLKRRCVHPIGVVLNCDLPQIGAKAGQLAVVDRDRGWKDGACHLFYRATIDDDPVLLETVTLEGNTVRWMDRESGTAVSAAREDLHLVGRVVGVQPDIKWMPGESE
jgi:transcriptional regulator with XRE-family HTH domain